MLRNKNISKALIGKKLSKEHATKNKEHGFKIGHEPWNKNKKGLIHWTPERRLTMPDKISKGRKGKHIGFIPWNKGIIVDKNKYPTMGHFKKHTEESKQVIKEARAKQIFPIKDTKIEIKIREFLDTLQIEYYQHKYISEINHAYQCDFFIPSMNLVIECDGDYWHSYPTGRDIDRVRTSELIEKGFKILRLWEFEIKEMNINNFKERLLK